MTVYFLCHSLEEGNGMFKLPVHHIVIPSEAAAKPRDLARHVRARFLALTAVGVGMTEYKWCIEDRIWESILCRSVEDDSPPDSRLHEDRVYPAMACGEGMTERKNGDDGSFATVATPAPEPFGSLCSSQSCSSQYSAFPFR